MTTTENNILPDPDRKLEERPSHILSPAQVNLYNIQCVMDMAVTTEEGMDAKLKTVRWYVEHTYDLAQRRWAIEEHGINPHLVFVCPDCEDGGKQDMEWPCPKCGSGLPN